MEYDNCQKDKKGSKRRLCGVVGLWVIIDIAIGASMIALGVWIMLKIKGVDNIGYVFIGLG